ncbi:hypothetical protein H310_03391 [Aphanomyces invadans]|uniref:Uncharacterized protein n=1 Tax=Aphanomyces invadans TaxID=157072 RepID=A0A024UGW4_9STRA|nr:hypothetical protein H310_03391 [Aphanomyces invadans]ETW05671.1 hypothetical protein H310_03391 [Aphanomyces invadans]|eukprot:XP_008865448.1 hypothetical protein H310_03391 [Aphanomyces invadans]
MHKGRTSRGCRHGSANASNQGGVFGPSVPVPTWIIRNPRTDGSLIRRPIPTQHVVRTTVHPSATTGARMERLVGVCNDFPCLALDPSRPSRTVQNPAAWKPPARDRSTKRYAHHTLH